MRVKVPKNRLGATLVIGSVSAGECNRANAAESWQKWGLEGFRARYEAVDFARRQLS